MTDEEIIVDDDIKLAFEFLKNQFDVNDNKRQAIKKKRSEAGKKGGAPKDNSNASKKTAENEEEKQNNQKQPKTTKIKQNNQNETKQTIYEYDNEYENENKEIEDKSSIKKERNSESIFDSSMLPPIPPPPSPEEEKKEPTKRFVPPSLEEVKAYIKEKGYTFSAEAFVGYYESNGWMVGKNKMKNWHGACATWQSKRNEEHQSSVSTQVMRNKRYEQYKPNNDGADTKHNRESDNELW